METCKDCLHFEVCAYCVNDLPICDSFKDRTKYAEVVRCKDCKYQGRASCPTYYEDRMTYRDCWALDGDNDFCSDGVRRDEE